MNDFTTYDFHIMKTVSNRMIAFRVDGGIVDKMVPFEECVKEIRVRDLVK